MSETPQAEEELKLTDADRVYVGWAECVCVCEGVCKKVVFSQQLSELRTESDCRMKTHTHTHAGLLI